LSLAQELDAPIYRMHKNCVIIVWDEPKRRRNIEVHGFDFKDVEGAFDFAEATISPGHSGRDGRGRLVATGFLGDDLVLVNRPRGRPKAERTKIEVKLRLDPEVVEAFKAQGPGWQTRMNAVLRGSIAGTKQVSPAPRRSRSASSRPGK
jgi:uncharacterized DUF497 family protein